VKYLLLLGAVALAAQERGPLQLSLKRAVEIATSPEGSTQIQLSGEALRQAGLRSKEARAALLPDVEGAFSYLNRTANLAAQGITLAHVPFPGISFPVFVGPFNTMDGRLSASQTVLNLTSIRQYQASKVGVSAAKSDSENVTEQVAAVVARAYLAAVRAVTDVETAQANVMLSQAVLTQAENAGTGTGIEITRARVQLANDQQHLLVAQNERKAAHLRLLRAMGLRLDTDLELTDRLQYVPVDTVTLEQARAQALKERPDYKAQQERESNARLMSSATTLERLPTLAALGDYGSSGAGFSQVLPTRTVGLSLKVPVFDGARRDARRAESQSQYRAERVRTSDLKEQIELDVRLALDELSSAQDEVTVAKDGLDLAGSELEQARRRYQAGVSDSLEVTDAQTRLERARDNQTAALYNYSVARIDLAQAMGAVRRAIQ
jgi:outer membrane protein